jgi:hypothetical protein
MPIRRRSKPPNQTRPPAREDLNPRRTTAMIAIIDKRKRAIERELGIKPGKKTKRTR